LFIVRGRFDQAKVLARADQLVKDNPERAKVSKAGATKVYELALGRGLFVVMPDKNTIVAGGFRDYVTDVLDKAAGKKKTQLQNKELQSMIAAADAKQSMWLAITGRMAYGFDTQVTKVNGRDVAKVVRETLAGGGVETVRGGLTASDGIKTEILINM